MLLDAGVPPHQLELEITEGTIMADPVRAAAVLRRLDDLGVVLSLDDFGTGYSSLSRLRELPISEIKIDRRSPRASRPTSATWRSCARRSSSAQPRLLGRGRGPRDRRGAATRDVAGLRHRAGLPHRAAARRGRDLGMAG
jgi:hypothetical protein